MVVFPFPLVQVRKMGVFPLVVVGMVVQSGYNDELLMSFQMAEVEGKMVFLAQIHTFLQTFASFS
jgi:hypothetical protein